MMREINFLAFAPRRFGRCFPCFAVLLLVVGCSSGGGGGGGGSGERAGPFSFIEPHSDYAILNWTNPRIANEREGIYKFTVRYEAVSPLSEGAIRSAIAASGLGDLSGLVERAVSANGSVSRILDWDEDGIAAGEDNCLYLANPAQADEDRDGVGDGCDALASSLRFVPREGSVGIGWVNPLRPAGSRGKITSFILKVTGPFSFLDDEVVLTAGAAGAETVSFDYGGRAEGYGSSRRWDSWYEYNRSDLLNSLYGFELAMTYRDGSGEEVRQELAASHSPLGFGYSGEVVLGANNDGDGLRDTAWDTSGRRLADLDDDDDGILDESDSHLGADDGFPLVSALGAEVEMAYNGSDLDLFGSERASFYRLDGLAPGSYYTFEVRAHIRRYHNRDLAAALGYSGSSAIGGAYEAEREVAVARQRIPILLGVNHDNDSLADVLDPDDDNDGLSDLMEPVGNISGRRVDCSLVADCDGDGLSDAEEYYIDGDGSLGRKSLANRSVLVDGERRDCLVYADCDEDGIMDREDAFPLDAGETRDSDGDGVGDNIDNCPLVANAAQADREGDGRGDACEGVRTGRYEYRGSVGSLDLTVLPGEDSVHLSWRNVRPAGVGAGLNISSESDLNISAVYLGWRVHNVLLNETSGDWQREGLNGTGLASVYDAGSDYAIGSFGRYVLNRSDLPSSEPAFVWYSQSDRAYEFNLTFGYGGLVNATVYDWTDLVWLLANTDGDEYSDLVDGNDDNDGLSDEAESGLVNADGVLCSLLADCDGDGVADESDAFPLDAAETRDSDGDGIGDNRDNYDGAGLDQDEDRVGDGSDSCAFLADRDGLDSDGDGVKDGCDSNGTVANELWLVPAANALMVSWRNVRAASFVNISYRAEGSADTVLVGGLSGANLTGGGLGAGSYAHYRLAGLTDGTRYFVELLVGLNETGTDAMVLGNLSAELYSAVVGLNTDGDWLADSVDADDDNDGLSDEAESGLMNEDGELCSLLADCDGDGVLDRMDELPLDAMGVRDSDGDGVADLVDAFANNSAEHLDRDFDGLGDNTDNCDLYYNPAQENRDGDRFGDPCDADDVTANDAQGDSLPRLAATSRSYETVRDMTDPLNASRVIEVTELFSEVSLRWTNPVEVYLPYALPQPLLAKGLKGLRVEWLEGAESDARLVRINGGVGFDLSAGGQNVYRISGLPSRTDYRFRVIGVYAYSASRHSSMPAAVEALEREVVLGEVSVRTPRRVRRAPVLDLLIQGGEDGIELSWTNPELVGTAEIAAFNLLGCRLDAPMDSCEPVSLARLDQDDGLFLASEARNRFVVGEDLVNRSYLYDFRLGIVYEGTERLALSPLLRSALYPRSSDLPGLTGLVSRDGEEGFALEWSDPSAEAILAANLTRLGARIAGYTFTVRSGSLLGEVLASRFYDNIASLSGRLASAALLPAASAGRLYHISVGVHWTTGQVTPIGSAERVLAAIWPAAAGVEEVALVVSDVALELSWTNPATRDFIAIGEGISNYSIVACRADAASACTAARVVSVSSPLDVGSYPTHYDFAQAAGLEYGVAYRLYVRVHWTTGQVSDAVVSDAAMIARPAYPGVSVDVVSGAEGIGFRWLNPVETSGLTIDRFEVIPCRYDSPSAADCTAGTMILLDGDSSPAVETGYGAAVDFILSAGLDRAYLYSFEVKVVYVDGSATEFESAMDETDLAYLYPAAAAGLDAAPTGMNEFGAFELSWAAPSASADFARVGHNVSGYRLVFAELDALGTQYETRVPLAPLSYSHQALQRLLSVQGLPLVFALGEVYEVKVGVVYSTGQESSLSAAAQVSLGPVRVAPQLLEATTGKDALEVRWQHSGLAAKFSALGYELEYFTGFNCAASWDSCEEFLPANAVDGISSYFIAHGIERGALYNVSVWGNWTLGDEVFSERSRELRGGIYPVIPSLSGLAVASTQEGMLAEWVLPDLGASASFAEHTGYRLAELRVNVTNVDDEAEVVSLSVSGSSSSATFVDEVTAGVLYRVWVAATYRGRLSGMDEELAIRQTAEEGAPEGGRYPAALPPPRNLLIDSRLNDINLRWDAPELMVTESFRTALGFGVANYSVAACSGNCIHLDSFAADAERNRVFGPDQYDVERAVVYNMTVTAHYEGKTHPAGSVEDLAASTAVGELGYIFPQEAPAVSGLEARQLEGANRALISWTNPDFSNFTRIGVTAVYQFSLCDSGGTCDLDIGTSGMRAVPLSSPLDRLEIETSYGSGYVLKIRIVYHSDEEAGELLQSEEVSSPAFDVVRPPYPVVEGLMVSSSADGIDVVWTEPGYDSSAGVTLTGYRLSAVCQSVEGNDCSGGDYEWDYNETVGSVRLLPDTLARQVLYDISMVVTYEDGGGAVRQSARSGERVGAIYPLLEPIAAPEILAGQGEMRVRWQPMELAETFADYFGYEVESYRVELKNGNTDAANNPSVGNLSAALNEVTFTQGAAEHPNFEVAELYSVRVKAFYRVGNEANGIEEAVFEGPDGAFSEGGAYPAFDRPLQDRPTAVREGEAPLLVSWNPLAADLNRISVHIWTGSRYVTAGNTNNPAITNFQLAYNYYVAGYRVRACEALNPALCYSEDSLDNRTESLFLSAGRTSDGYRLQSGVDYSISVSALYWHENALVESDYLFAEGRHSLLTEMRRAGGAGGRFAEGRHSLLTEMDDDGDGVFSFTDIDDDGDGLIEISTAAQLDAVRYVLNGSGRRMSATEEIDQTGCGNGDTITECNGYELAADINLTDYIADTYGDAGWQPIAHDTSSSSGCQGGAFSTVFDGDDYAISGLRINRPKQHCIGLFGFVHNGEIRRLNLRATSIAGELNVGGLIGFGRDFRIESSSVAAVNISAESYVGGLVGIIIDGEGFINSAAVNIGGRISGISSLGGLVGRVDSTSITIRSSAAIVDTIEGVRVAAIDELTLVGGIIGRTSSSSVIIEESFAVCRELKARRSHIGGLVGSTDGRISSSYAVCEKLTGIPVLAEGSGCIGLCDYLSQAYTAGLVSQYGGRATSSLAISGSVHHPSSMNSGLVLENYGGNSFPDSYWDADTSGISGSEGRSTVVLRSPTSADGIYSSWDDTIWDFGTSSEYPALKNNFYSPAQQRSFYSLNEDGNLTVHSININDGLLIPSDP